MKPSFGIQLTVIDLSKESPEKRADLMKRHVPRSAKNTEMDCRQMVAYYDMIMANGYWSEVAESPEAYFETYFKRPIAWIEHMKAGLALLDEE